MYQSYYLHAWRCSDVSRKHSLYMYRSLHVGSCRYMYTAVCTGTCRLLPVFEISIPFGAYSRIVRPLTATQGSHNLPVAPANVLFVHCTWYMYYLSVVKKNHNHTKIIIMAASRGSVGQPNHTCTSDQRRRTLESLPCVQHARHPRRIMSMPRQGARRPPPF